MIEGKIYLIPAGRVDERIMEDIKAGLSRALPVAAKVEIQPEQKLSGSTYNASRGQYNAGRVLKDLYPRLKIDMRNEQALVIVDVDLYEEGLNFVFGLADADKGVSIISLTRLKNEFFGLKPDEKLFLNRVLKEAIHELGHTWGLPHCADSKCVMHFSNCLLDTDRKDFTFCTACRNKLLQQ